MIERSCPNCKGLGRVARLKTTEDATERCHRCEGTGRLREKIENGRHGPPSQR